MRLQVSLWSRDVTLVVQKNTCNVPVLPNMTHRPLERNLPGVGGAGGSRKYILLMWHEGWLVDSEASQHVVYHRKLLVTLKPAASDSVNLVNGLRAPIMGAGEIMQVSCCKRSCMYPS